jgi:uncharacterized protein
MDMRAENIKKMIAKWVHELDPDAEVYLFGSRARGDFKKDSDWDLLILTNSPVTLKDEQRFRHHLIPLELETGEAFSTFVFERKDWETRHNITPFYQNVTNESIQI